MKALARKAAEAAATIVVFVLLLAMLVLAWACALSAVTWSSRAQT